MHALAAPIQYMGIDHGGADILMSEQLLYGTDVVARLKVGGGKGMTEGVAARGFVDSHLPGCLIDHGWF